jgi:hypothetical protein
LKCRAADALQTCRFGFATLLHAPRRREDGDGRYDVIEVETRGPFKGPRACDASALPLHFDDQSVFKECICRDKADPKLLHDEMTVTERQRGSSHWRAFKRPAALVAPEKRGTVPSHSN